MSDSVSLDIRAALNWLFQDTLDLATVSDSARVEYSQSLVDGTAADQADKIWHDQRTVAAGASDDLDLTALVQAIFGGSLSLALAKVKALFIVNTSTTSGQDLKVGGSGANAFAAPFDADDDAKVLVPADSMLLLVNKKSGWPVTNGSADTLRINNPGAAAVTYKIVIVGTSA